MFYEDNNYAAKVLEQSSTKALIIALLSHNHIILYFSCISIVLIEQLALVAEIYYFLGELIRQFKSVQFSTRTFGSALIFYLVWVYSEWEMVGQWLKARILYGNSNQQPLGRKGCMQTDFSINSYIPHKIRKFCHFIHSSYL